MFLSYQLDYLLWLQNFRELTNDIFTPFFLAITHFGDISIPLLLIAFIYWSLDKKFGEFIIINLFFGFLCNQFLKMIFCIHRPWILSDKIKPVIKAVPRAFGYSFPSGHTACAMAVWGGLAVKLWEKKIIIYSLFALILLIAFSRNYLGVHTPQDVLVSIFLGIIILFITKKLFDKIDNNDFDFKIFIAGISFIAITLITVWFKNYFNAATELSEVVKSNLQGFYMDMGSIIGLIIGWYACRKLIPFSTTGISPTKRILRFLLGIGILIPLMLFSHDIFVNDFGKTGGEVTYAFVISIFITFFYPWIFTRIERIINERFKKNE